MYPQEHGKNLQSILWQILGNSIQILMTCLPDCVFRSSNLAVSIRLETKNKPFQYLGNPINDRVQVLQWSENLWSREVLFLAITKYGWEKQFLFFSVQACLTEPTYP